MKVSPAHMTQLRDAIEAIDSPYWRNVYRRRMALTDETLRCMYCGKEHWSDPLYWYGNPSEPGVVCPECFRAGKTEPAGKQHRGVPARR